MHSPRSLSAGAGPGAAPIRSMIVLVATSLALTFLAADASASTPPPTADAWHPIGTGMISGVSGAVLTSSTPSGVTALIARDNKKAGENRLSSVSLADGRAPVITPLTWTGDLPQDIEALDAVPGRPGEYVTLTSHGDGQHITVAGSRVTVNGTFQVPGGPAKPKYEGFALGSAAGRLVAVWADRGNGDSPSTVTAAPFDLATLGFGTPVNMQVSAPDMPSDARDVSDVKIASGGRLLVTSAWEEGDDGPFEGVLYNAGTVSLTAGKVALTPATDPRPLMAFDSEKVEAIACDPDAGRCLLGADNENLGGSLRAIHRQPGAAR